MRLLMTLQRLLDTTRAVDFLGPLALRLYLAPVFWVSGMEKVAGFGDIVEWFGNPEWGLGLPMPWLMAFLATAAEVIGAVLLTIGLATRWVAIPLMATMIVAAATVHLDYGWQAIADAKAPYASEYLGPLQIEDADPALERKARAVGILEQHGNYQWLTDNGRYSYVVLNNGIEFAATYFIMLLVLFFVGAGRFFSIDYWIARKFNPSES